MDAISAARLLDTCTFTFQDCANTAWTWSTLGITDLHLLFSSCERSASPRYECNSQGIANTLWAVSTRVFLDAPVLHALLAASLLCIATFEPQHLGFTAWAVAA